MVNKIETKLLHVDKNVEDNKSCVHIVDAARLIRAGEVVAFPTETVYGLGANALSDEAVGKIYQAKGRPSDNPLIVHIGEMSQLALVARDVSDDAQRLIDAFWPGPLTLILPSTSAVAKLVTAGLPTVGVRMPDHPVALELIRQANVPIAAPSANLSGRPSPTSAEHVRKDLAGKIAAILDGGQTGVGVESTVIDMTVYPALILRPGGVTYEQIKSVLGQVEMDPAFLVDAETSPRSPGMKYAHYAPKGELWLVSGETAAVRRKMEELLLQAKRSGLRTGVLATAESASLWSGKPFVDAVLPCGSSSDLAAVARDLYATLRAFDDLQIQFIVSETFPRTDMGLAVMNRLEKAAAGRILSV